VLNANADNAREFLNKSRRFITNYLRDNPDRRPSNLRRALSLLIEIGLSRHPRTSRFWLLSAVEGK
jgi:hypothetical protein